MQKAVAFLYTNNKLSKRQMNEMILFTTALKRIRYLGITLAKEVKDLNTENYKTLMKKTEEGTKK